MSHIKVYDIVKQKKCLNNFDKKLIKLLYENSEQKSIYLLKVHSRIL